MILRQHHKGDRKDIEEQSGEARGRKEAARDSCQMQLCSYGRRDHGLSEMMNWFFIMRIISPNFLPGNRHLVIVHPSTTFFKPQ